MMGRFLLALLTVELGFPMGAFAERLVVLTAYPEEVVSRYQAAFKKVRPDIELEILWRMPRDALPYLRQPRQGGVDVYWSAAYANFLALKAEHAWRRLDIDRAALPGRIGGTPLDDPEGISSPPSLRAMALESIRTISVVIPSPLRRPWRIWPNRSTPGMCCSRFPPRWALRRCWRISC